MRQHASVAGEENTVERDPFFGSPWPDRKIRPSNRRMVNPRSAAGQIVVSVRRLLPMPGMESGGESVERVRNPGDGRFRSGRGDHRDNGRQASSRAEGEGNPRRGALAIALAGAVVGQKGFEETGNPQRGANGVRSGGDAGTRRPAGPGWKRPRSHGESEAPRHLLYRSGVRTSERESESRGSQDRERGPDSPALRLTPLEGQKDV